MSESVDYTKGIKPHKINRQKPVPAAIVTMTCEFTCIGFQGVITKISKKIVFKCAVLERSAHIGVVKKQRCDII